MPEREGPSPSSSLLLPIAAAGTVAAAFLITITDAPAVFEALLWMAAAVVVFAAVAGVVRR